MAVTQEQLQKLKEQIPYKWREQSVNERGATMVAYIDARSLYDQLDNVCGIGNWQTDFKLIDGNLFGGIGVLIAPEGSDLRPYWVWKWDVGTESNVEKAKGESSDAVKRAGVQFGIGRFLYSLGIVTLKSADYKGKHKPADDDGKILWDRDKITELCNKAVKDGKLDRTRLQATTSAPKKSDSEPKKTNLEPGSENWTKVVTALKNKTGTMSQVLSKYSVSKENQAKLEQESK